MTTNTNSPPNKTGKVLAFPERRHPKVQPKYFREPDEIIGLWKSYYKGTGLKFPRPTPEIVSDGLRDILSSLLSFSPGRHDDIFSPLSTAIHSLSRLVVECDLTNERDEAKRLENEVRS